MLQDLACEPVEGGASDIRVTHEQDLGRGTSSRQTGAAYQALTTCDPGRCSCRVRRVKPEPSQFDLVAGPQGVEVGGEP